MIAARSPVVRVAVSLVTPLAVTVALYFFFAGHNQPGGGFAAGLILGAVLAIRTVAGLSTPSRAVPLLAAGGLIAVAVSVLPVLTGSEMLDQVVVDVDLPLVGVAKTGTALVFDAGVTLVVVGVVVSVLTGLGADELDDSATAARSPR